MTLSPVSSLLTRCKQMLHVSAIAKGALVALFVFSFAFTFKSQVLADAVCDTKIGRSGTCNNGSQANPICIANGFMISNGCAAQGCPMGTAFTCVNGVFQCLSNSSCPTPTPVPQTGGGSGGGGTGGGSANYCPDGSGAVTRYVKYTCPNGCTVTTEGGITAPRCYLNPTFSNTPVAMGSGECGQVDALKGDGSANSGNYCGHVSYTCDAGYCQPGSSVTPPPTVAPPAGGATPIPQPACGYACTTEEFCDAAVVYLVPKYLNDTAKYAVLDKVVVGSTTIQEDSTTMAYYNTWASYGPAAGYLDGASKVRYAAGISGGTATWVAFYVNGPSFTVYTDKGANRGGFDVYINGAKVSTGLDNLYQAGTTYTAFNTTITVPGYDANKYTCATVGTAKQCRLTSNPTSATCTPPAATPTPTPAALACYGVSRDNANPTKGSQVSYTETAVPADVLNGRTATYEGKCEVKQNGATVSSFALTPISTGASKFTSFPVQYDNATYECVFRYCLSDGQCIPWGTVPGTATVAPATIAPRATTTTLVCPTAQPCPAGQTAVPSVYQPGFTCPTYTCQ